MERFKKAVRGIGERFNAYVDELNQPVPRLEELEQNFPHLSGCEGGEFVAFSNVMNMGDTGWGISVPFTAYYLRCSGCNVQKQYAQE